MKTLEVGSLAAKNQLSRLLAMVEKGQRIFITRRGKRVALLTSALDRVVSPGEEGAPQELIERFRHLRSAARKGPESLRELIEQGRR